MRRVLLVAALLLVSMTAFATDGPLTNLMNLRGKVDENGYLRISVGSAGVTDGPLTNLTNLKGRTDENGYLRVSMAGAITAGSGTGITVNDAGSIRAQSYKVTIASTAFVCNDVTCDVTIGTLPAKTFLIHALADKVTPFTCASVCTTSSLSMTLGKSGAGNQYLLSFDADSAAAQYGDAAAELGASLAPATVATMNGDLGSWASTQAVVVRLTSGVGNIGNGTVTNLGAGSVTFYLTTIKLP